MAGRSFLSRTQVFDNSGHPLAGARAEHYESGTSTPLDTYSDDALSIDNANPVVADSAGRFGDIFLKDQDYKVVLKSSAGVTIWTADPVRASEPRSTAVINKTTTYVVTGGDAGKLITADATAGAFTITLPAAADAGDGFEAAVIKSDTSDNAVTVDGDGSETINGETSIDLAAQFDSVLLRSNGTAWFAIVAPVSTSTPLPRGYIDGLTLSNNSLDGDHDIDIAPGAARDDSDQANLPISTTLIKRIDAAWAVGSNNGGLDTGTVANTTWYHVWLIRRSDTGVVDALFSTSATAPTMPSNYDQKRLRGAVLTDGSANILPFMCRDGEFFEWVTPVLDVNDTSPTASDAGKAYTLSAPPNSMARVNVISAITSAGATSSYIRPTDVTDDTPSTTGLPGFSAGVTSGGASSAIGGSIMDVWVDASSQVQGSINTANTDLIIITLGYCDRRGRNA